MKYGWEAICLEESHSIQVYAGLTRRALAHLLLCVSLGEHGRAAAGQGARGWTGRRRRCLISTALAAANYLRETDLGSIDERNWALLPSRVCARLWE